MRTPIDDCATTRARKRMNHQRAWRDGHSINDDRWPLRLGVSLLLVALVLLAALFLVTGREAGAVAVAATTATSNWPTAPIGGRNQALPLASSSSSSSNSNRIKHQTGVARSLRSLNNGLSSSSSYGLSVPLSGSSVADTDAAPIPYKTFFVTQACEWKSNLFVPKSNDLHFAQPTESSLVVGSANVGAKLPSSGHVDGFSGVGARQQAADQESRTIFSTTQKALILALPIELGANFAGFEPACSIRLIVPRNMRILAKLTARKLSFAPQVVGSPTLAPFESPLGQSAVASTPAQDERQLWLNVSSDQFGELEQRELESDSNVLAFRFLLERFAHRREPETRFQVVVSAFQTLGENSGFNQANPALDGGQQEQQFICDSQRIISPSLLCDGFANCQDGSDEVGAHCAAFLRPKDRVPDPPRNQTAPSQTEGGKAPAWLPGGPFSDSNPLLGFLLGLLLVLLLLTTCTCCLYCLYLLLRNALFGRRERDHEAEAEAERSARRLRAARQRHLLRADSTISEQSGRRAGSSLFARLNFLGLGQRFKGGSSSSSPVGGRRRRHHEDRRAGSAEETDSLARNQNAENAARLKAQSLLERAAATSGLPPAPSHRQPPPAHSILKRPSPLVSVGAPLARFESIPYSSTPAAAAAAGSSGLTPAPRTAGRVPPQPPPHRASERAVDVGPGASSSDEQPTKPRGALAHSLTHARDSGRRTHHDFRPTPAARGQPRGPAPPTSSRSQHFSSTASTSGGGGGGGALPRSPRAASGETATSEQLLYRSSSSQVEQTSRQTGSQRLTVYQYSSSVAQFSESYLQQQHREQPPPGEPPNKRPPAATSNQPQSHHHQVQQARQL